MYSHDMYRTVGFNILRYLKVVCDHIVTILKAFKSFSCDKLIISVFPLYGMSISSVQEGDGIALIVIFPFASNNLLYDIDAVHQF